MISYFLGTILGVYFSAVVNALVNLVLGMDLLFFNIFNIKIIKKDGKFTVRKKAFNPFICVSYFTKEGASIKNLDTVQVISLLTETLLAFLIFNAAIIFTPRDPDMRMNFAVSLASGVLSYCVIHLFSELRAILGREKSVDGYTKYLIKRLQTGLDLKDTDVSTYKLDTLKKPDSLRVIYLTLSLMKARTENDENAIYRALYALEDYAKKNPTGRMKKAFLMPIAEWYCTPQSLKREGNADKARFWFNEWTKNAPRPYDAGEEVLMAYYRFYVEGDVNTAINTLAQAEKILPDFAATDYEISFYTKRIEDIKRDMDTAR